MLCSFRVQLSDRSPKIWYKEPQLILLSTPYLKLAISLNYHWSLHQRQFRGLACIMGSYGRSHKKDVLRKLALSLNYHWSLRQGQFRVLGCIMGSFGRSHKKDVPRPYSGGTARHHHWPRAGREGGQQRSLRRALIRRRRGRRRAGARPAGPEEKWRPITSFIGC